MESNQKYIVYQTTNLKNGKIYIGVHKTEDPEVFDGYLGCGAYINKPNTYNLGKTYFHKAILKYGTNSFRRTTLKVFDTIEEALEFEKEIVDIDFVKRSTTYNSTVGGGMPPKTNKIVYQFDINGVFVKEWESETEILKYYNSKVSLTTIIKDKRSFAGHFWSFEKEINVKDFKVELNRGFINQYTLDGIFLNQFKTTTEAAQKLDLKRESITQSVFSKKPFAGFYFLKADVDIAEVIKIKPSLGKQKIFRYLKTGEFDAEFSTTSKAVNATPKASTSSLKNAVVNGYLCGGYRWSYKKSDNYFNIENPKEQIKIKIAQYDKQGNLIKIWDSPKECKKEYPYCLKVCQGRTKSTQNYVFKYID